MVHSELTGVYRITMTLPAWTVENELTLLPEENGVLGGSLNTLDGSPPIPFTRGRWNKNCFQLDAAVGPGRLQLTGRVEGGVLGGVVVIEDTPDLLRGARIQTEIR